MQNPFKRSSALLCAPLGLLSISFLARPVPRAGDGDDDPPTRSDPNDIAARYASDAMRMANKIADLELDNLKLRNDKRDNKREIDRLSTEVTTLKGNVPAEGAKVLTAEEQKQWDAWNALGKPEDVAAKIQAGQTAIELNAVRDKKDKLAEAAGLAKFKPDVLQLFGKDWELDIRELDTLVDGKVVRKKEAFVVTKVGDKETPVLLSEYAKSQGENVYKLLQAETTTQTTDDGNPADAVGNNLGDSSGINFPAQGGGQAAGSSLDWGKLDQIADSRYDYLDPKK